MEMVGFTWIVMIHGIANRMYCLRYHQMWQREIPQKFNFLGGKIFELKGMFSIGMSDCQIACLYTYNLTQVVIPNKDTQVMYHHVRLHDINIFLLNYDNSLT